MAFKMKGPSMQAGTTAHRSALKEIGDSLERMNRGRKASPVKEDEDAATEPLTKEQKRKAKEQYKKDKKKAKKVRDAKDAEIKKQRDAEKAEKKKQDKIAKDKKRTEKRKAKLKKIESDTDKEGTAVSRTAKKIWSGKDKDGDGKGDGGIKGAAKKTGKAIGKAGKWLWSGKDTDDDGKGDGGIKGAVTKGVKNVKEGIKRRKEERQHKKDKWNEMSVEDRIDARKEKRSKIADNLEYIFLDGKRPEEAAYRRKHGYYRDEDENKLDNKDNNSNDEIDPNDNKTNEVVEKNNKNKNKIDWTKAPALNTQARIDWYKKHNLALDHTTTLK